MHPDTPANSVGHTTKQCVTTVVHSLALASTAQTLPNKLLFVLFCCYLCCSMYCLYLCCSMYCLYLCCSMYCLYLCCSMYCLQMCTVVLPPGVNPNAVDKYISYHINPFHGNFSTDQ